MLCLVGGQGAGKSTFFRLLAVKDEWFSDDLRRLDDETCELKRLYVRPAFRGRGIAGVMMQRILDDARAIGYTVMLLDTLPFLTSAIRMYRALGFYDIPPYNDSPLDTTIFLRLDL